MLNLNIQTYTGCSFENNKIDVTSGKTRNEIFFKINKMVIQVKL